MKERKQNLIAGIIISIFFAFTVLFYGPLSQYLPNAQELWFNLEDVFKVIVPLSLLEIAIAAVFFLIVPPKAGTFFLKLFFGVSLAFYVQGNYLPSTYGTGVMDGTKVDWGQYQTYGIINTIIWAVCIALPFVAEFIYRKVKDSKDNDETDKRVAAVIIIASLFCTAVQIPALAVQAINYEPKEDGGVTITTDGMFQISDKENVFMFILDTIDEEYYQEYVKNHPDVEKKLTGFTHYDNNLASGSRTTMAVPSMITGKPFKKQSTYSEFIKSIYSEDNPLSQLNMAGYDVGVYSESVLFSEETSDYVMNIMPDTGIVGSWMILTKKIYKLDLCKFLPHFLKKYIWFDTAEFESAKEDTDRYRMNDVKFYNNYKKEGFSTDGGNKVFRLYHRYGAHEPYTMNSKIKRVKETTCTEQVAGTINIVMDMLDELKEKGLYDNSTIIITADHGDKFKAGYAMLLVKKAGDTSEYKTTHVPSSSFDLALFLSEIAGEELDDQEYGMKLDSLTEGMKRERHMFHNMTNDSRFVIEEYKTNGDAGDFSSYELVNVYKETEDENTPYELGTKLMFDVNATGNKYCLEGIWKTSGFRTFMRGPHIVFSVPIKNMPESGGLNVHFDFHFKTVKGLKMIAEANGTKVLDTVTDQDMIDNGLDITVPEAAMKDTDKLRLEIDFPEIDEKETEMDVEKQTDTLSLISMVIDKAE